MKSRIFGTRGTARSSAVARRGAVALLAVGALTLSACGGDDSSSSGGSSGGGDEITLKIGMGTDAESLDPPNFLISADLSRIDLIFDRLVKLSPDGEIQPGLATSWEQVDDVTWTFTLREGVTFHDGTEFNAEAAKAVLERSQTQDQGEAFLGVIDTIEAPDATTLTLKLSRPYASILNNLAVPVAAMYSPASIEKYGDTVGQNPVGTGPFKFVEWQMNAKLVLEANDDYWGDAPTVDRVELIPIPETSTRLSALRSGEVDVIENPNPDEVDSLEAEGITAVIEPKARPIFLGINTKVVTDPQVRKAIAMAIDKEAIVEAVLEGLGTPATDSLVTPAFRGDLDPVGIDHDVAGAKALLAGKSPADLTFRVVVPTERYLRDTAAVEVIQSQLAEVGITLNMDIRDSGAWYQALLDRDTELYWLGWGLNSYDPGDLFTRLFKSGAVNNMSQLESPTVDGLIAQLEGAPIGSDQRFDLYGQLETAIVEDEVAVVPIYHSVNLFAARKGVTGFHTTPGELLDLSKVKVG